MTRKVIFLWPLFFLMGCSTQIKSANVGNGHTPEPEFDLSNASIVKNVLYSQYGEWKTVKYREGGLSKKGIDCSGFVYITYLSKFGIELPRTTEKMSRLGVKVSQENLSAGDLVFFKTGLHSRHVGIYLEKRKFIHASTSVGVTISSLDDYYWAKKYWKSIRISVAQRLLGNFKAGSTINMVNTWKMADPIPSRLLVLKCIDDNGLIFY